MEPSATGEQATDRDQEAVHDWRVSQLMRLGIPGTLATRDAHQRAASSS
jgi:hypothetical protein